MIIQELFNQISFDKIWQMMVEQYNVEPIYKEEYKNTYKKMQNIKLAEQKTLWLADALYILDDLNNPVLDMLLVKQDEIKNKFKENSFVENNNSILNKTLDEIQEINQKCYENMPESYAMDLTEWNKSLGYEVNIDNKKTTLAEKAAAFFYEMTFLGLEEEPIIDFANELKETVTQLEQDIANGVDNCIPIDDIYKEFGFVDERTETEKMAETVKVFESGYQSLREKYFIIKEWAKAKCLI